MSKSATKGVLLVQLGTPDTPTTADVRKYLTEFLMDPRVMDIPYLGRTLLVKGAIVPKRAPLSAATYRTIWDEKTGSPLMYYSELQRDLLQKELGEDYHVELAMRYQNPSIASALAKMERMKLDSVRVISLFPQYASATTGSVIDKVMEIMRSWQYFPQISFVSSYCDDEEMCEVFADHGRKFDIDTYDHILFSYHGLPVRQLGKVDPTGELKCPQSGCDSCRIQKNAFCYLSQCYATSRAIAAKLQLSEERYTVCFQSRLGKTPWIQPYTSDTLHQLAEKGVKRLLVFSPAFVSDCIETLDEIQVEYANEFKSLGGEEVAMVESLNDDPRWISVLKRLAQN
ncbi:ferrochelatase [Sphingobacterium allocomposti]|jgi:ferrochelatase|uniref:Ferrochelatase n=1 Tax=Sphingobacterium allocomposti TaxID=415956 RepID=A0A5S5DTM2_9SPHI|nr:ferrochelatase [Sphingobacterium composti Yoo et al. 2007 non Ten et al. 2007]TYP98356.1 ferrochelatase [Sphingobacterium composti Yoo et al. 2007 non Ten et al. 2007]